MFFCISITAHHGSGMFFWWFLFHFTPIFFATFSPILPPSPSPGPPALSSTGPVGASVGSAYGSWCIPISKNKKILQRRLCAKQWYMIAWVLGKRQPQHRRPFFDIELHIIVHKSFVSTSTLFFCSCMRLIDILAQINAGYIDHCMHHLLHDSARVFKIKRNQCCIHIYKTLLICISFTSIFFLKMISF